VETGHLLPWWELDHGLHELLDDHLRRHQKEKAVGDPLVVKHRGLDVGTLERIAPQVKKFWKAQFDEGFLQQDMPSARCSMKWTFQLPTRSAIKSPSSLQYKKPLRGFSLTSPLR